MAAALLLSAADSGTCGIPASLPDDPESDWASIADPLASE
jgi:hypothetical protein